MPRILIAYSSVDGHTMKICDRLKTILERSGQTAELHEIGTGDSCQMASFDKVVIGASIRYGKHRPNVYRFVEANRDVLDRIPSAFFSVNVVARKPGKDTPALNPYVNGFMRRTTWRPGEIAVFAGRLDYPRYGFLDRQMIRLIMWLTNGPTDPKACVEFTDWQAVDNFALRLSCMGSAALQDGARSQSSANTTSNA